MAWWRKKERVKWTVIRGGLFLSWSGRWVPRNRAAVFETEAEAWALVDRYYPDDEDISLMPADRIRL